MEQTSANILTIIFISVELENLKMIIDDVIVVLYL